MSSSPGEAARGDIPPKYARALAVLSSPDVRHAVVLLGTNEEPVVYPYVVVCHKVDDEWQGGSGGNGAPGLTWSSISEPGDAQNLGVLIFAEEAPAAATAAVVRWRGRERTVPVTYGYIFMADWYVSEAHFDERPDRVSFLSRQ
jgi:hypothetical protein